MLELYSTNSERYDLKRYENIVALDGY
jgi:hypothetical protein